MGPARHSKLVARDRARRAPFARPAAPAHPIKPSPSPKLASIETKTTAADQTPQYDRFARAFIIAMIVMNGVSFGAVLGIVGWPMLQAAGWVAPSAIETQQHKQAAAISQVEASFDTLHATVIKMGARVDAVRDRQDAAGQRMADLDISVGALRSGLDEIRTVQSATKDAWREPVAELATWAAKTRSEVARLRSSVDDLNRARQTEGASARAEQAPNQRNPLATMRGSIQETERVGERPRPVEGHIISVAPAR